MRMCKAKYIWNFTTAMFIYPLKDVLLEISIKLKIKLHVYMSVVCRCNNPKSDDEKVVCVM